MKNIVISLKTASDRREHIQTQFGQQNIDFEFLDALTPERAAEYARQLELKFDLSRVTKGEIACFMSHVAVWDLAVQEGLDHVAIFEDDVFLGEDAKQFLSQDKWITKEWQIIKLEAFSKKVLLSATQAHLANERELHILKGRHLGGAGYILSLDAAKYLLHLVKQTKIVEPVDHILFDPIYHQQSTYVLYQMKPALCIQGYLYQTQNNMFLSSLEGQRIQRRKNESKSRSLVEKMQRELRRMMTQLSTFLYKKVMDFR